MFWTFRSWFGNRLWNLNCSRNFCRREEQEQLEIKMYFIRVLDRLLNLICAVGISLSIHIYVIVSSSKENLILFHLPPFWLCWFLFYVIVGGIGVMSYRATKQTTVALFEYLFMEGEIG